ncbi:hypothetical protein DPMN_151530 [Dreissena polymorpha]|uniref:protein-tyrosine-phosphatase n=1 Tax=Dreissena polymorpha TaxID=45954 RepID=A0A9D4FK52_DREPO|nr:hypothetical protein DPMN_151530 [Dreissena polymorpha]
MKVWLTCLIVSTICVLHNVNSQCAPDEWWNNTACTKCKLEGCTCNNGENCLQCTEGYYKDVLCRPCVNKNCSTCSSTQCITCKNGYTGSNCQETTQCPSNNCICTNQDVCSGCKAGYFNTSVSCIGQCIPECDTCLDDNSCETCKQGKYGASCEMACSNGCSANTCNKKDGTCACLSHFNGTKCDQCVSGRFGTSCELLCAKGCVIGSCNRIDGTCNCKTNFTGSKCDQCAYGRYGESCEMTCSAGCDGGLCNRTDGTCSSCKKNYAGIKCMECISGMYGNSCEQMCSKGCTGTACTRYNGTCSCNTNYTGDQCNQCVRGIYGTYCDKSCPIECGGKECFESNGTCVQCVTGRYGAFCENNCSKGCANGLCNAISGECTCTNNFNGKKCDECTTRRFGTACNNICSVGCNASVCNQIDGSCTCLENFVQAQCGRCVSGMYGTYCNTSCSLGCVNNACNRTDGHCECSTHFAGDKCDQCVPGRYGESCDKVCSKGCNASACDKMNGTCTCMSSFDGPMCDRCTDGNYLENCSSKCSPNCVPSTCNQTDRSCSACNEGYYGSNCTLTCKNECLTCDNGHTCLKAKNIVTTYAPNTEGPAKDSLPLAAIGGGAGGGVAVIVVVIVIVVICRRRKSRKNELNENELATVDGERNNIPVYATIQRESSVSHDSNGKSVTVATQNSTTAPKDKRDTGSKTDIDIAMNEENLEIDADEALARIRAIKFEEQGGVYYNSANEIQTGKIRVSELQKFVANKDTDIFEEEFEKLPYGLIKKYDESQRTVNMSMNRYKGIYPYNDSRVKVLGGHTDYINASFIDGYKRRNAFIATLGPMSKQLDDFAPFWRMIWQQKVDNIVMVTNLVEEGKDKCEQYWPNVESSTLYGDIRVSCTTEDKHAEFIRRTFVINLKKEQRNVYHLHFTAWPDKWIPEDVTSIVEFRQKVLNVPVVLGGPTVVHCSAGIGRTGTYIALDILIREGENENMVDIPGCVVNMRQNRPNMVQTVEQYEYIHHALIHALTFDCKPVARDEFQKYMDGITDETMARKFTQLQTTVSQRPSEEKEAETRNRNHTDKNRDGADIPGDDNRPRLHLNLKPGASDYINAVYINSYRKAKHWILAQTPLPGTVTDFLTLALQENCSCIVSMEPDKEGDKTVGVYIAADNQVMKKGLFAVSGSDPVDNDYMTTRSMTISYRAAPGQPSKEHMIQHLQFTDWDMDRNVPRSPSNFLRFIKDVEAQDSLHASGPVLIHCLNGADKGGLLSVVAMLIEMMEVEREVSVVNAITKVKTRRRGVVSNQEQFAFCHECILEYISSFDTYSNYVNNLRI